MTSGIDRGRIEAAVRELLAAIGDDPDRPELARTPTRVADAYGEFFAGIGVDATEIARRGTVPADDGERGELVVVRGLRFRSVCEHHLLPFTGVAHVAYAPGDRLIGLGTVSRVLDAVASRPQLQERLGEQTAAAIAAGLRTDGVLVVLDAQHQCVTARGERQSGSTTVTVAATGVLADPVRRTETIALIGGGAGSADAAADHGADA